VATTTLGAEVGYTVLWLILLSCVIKIVVQNELGRYTIATGETALEAYDRVPGPRWCVSWVVWLWFFKVLANLMSTGAMLGGISQVLGLIFPALGLHVWVLLVSVVTMFVLFLGRYWLIEKVSIALVICFTFLTCGCAVLLLGHPEYFSWKNLAEGLAFQLPADGVLTAVAVFGTTGLSASELTYYPYWCLEKGYARFAGRLEESEEWRQRATGWIRVMGIDALTSMVVYTFATVAFFLLGAGVLHGMGSVPQGFEMVDTLSRMYTETLGAWAFYVFLVGAFAVFYSTIFAGVAASSRVLADFVRLLGLFNRSRYDTRLQITRIWVVVLLTLPTLYYYLVQAPVLMVKIAGFAQALMLPVIAFSTLYLGYRHLPRRIVPARAIFLGLWVCAASMALFFVVGCVLLLSGG
jgi:Mn2+/Fe2+ NRAMP family transporter